MIKHRILETLKKTLALTLVLIFCLTPVVQALDVDQFKELLQQYYIDAVPQEVLDQDSIQDVLNALGDPYTAYMDPDTYAQFQAAMQDQEVVGIGVLCAQNDEGLEIIKVYSDSPAKRQGLVPGDIITQVDGKNAAGQDADTIVGWLRGREGTTVGIKVLHADGTVGNYSIQRQLVEIPGTTTELVGDEENVGYILCTTFGEDTEGHFQDGMKLYSDAEVWVVDLRGNPGGDLSATSETLGLFEGAGNTLYLKNGSDQYLAYHTSQDALTISPVIVLTSGWTASASEVFSSAIRDDQDGIIIGDRTYGKGVAQIVLDQSAIPSYFEDGDAVKITAFRYYTMSGSTADLIGVIPHLLVNADDAYDIALLLESVEPSDNTGYLRFVLGGWRWYVNTGKAAENEALFTELLEAIPPTSSIDAGQGSDQWTETTVAQTAAALGLTDYQPRAFADAADSAYGTSINTLKTYGILNGCADGLYHPDRSMTRAELCALLVQAMGVSSSRTESVFQDVPMSAWYADSVNTAYDLGLVDGVGDGAFDPDGTVTEEQLITILARLGVRLNAYLYETAKKGMPDDNTVPDAFSSWSRQWVWLLDDSQYNILGTPVSLLFGPADDLAPQGAATRGEAAALLYNVLHYIDVLPS